MSPFIANLATRLFDFSGAGRSQVARVALLILLHLVALAIQIGTETRLVSQLAFALSWVFYNFFWIVLLRRPTVAAAMALNLPCPAHPTIPIQAPRAADDGQLRRPDDD